jgi:hypothetical protein
LFARVGPFRRQRWSTQIVDVGAVQLLDIVPGRDAVEPCRWFAERPAAWRAAIAWATLDLSGSYRTVFDTMLPDATQVADPFHVVRVANTALDECRRRVQNETVGHRGRKPDPLYRARRLLTMAAERLPDDRKERLVGLLAAGDPKGEAQLTWHAPIIRPWACIEWRGQCPVSGDPGSLSRDIADQTMEDHAYGPGWLCHQRCARRGPQRQGGVRDPRHLSQLAV